MLGGRSLRAMGDEVYDTSYMAEPFIFAPVDMVRDCVLTRLPALLADAVGANSSGNAKRQAAARIFNDVGGAEAWARLYNTMADLADWLESHSDDDSDPDDEWPGYFARP
jgi:hypothetical protein